MSHFTHIKTHFQNLLYLEKALNALNIITYKDQKNVNTSLIIKQANGYDIKFVWNGKEYELIADMSFWEQLYPIENFMDKVSQQYATKVIIGESEKTGFYPVQYKLNKDGSNLLTLERWNDNKM